MALTLRLFTYRMEMKTTTCQGCSCPFDGTQSAWIRFLSFLLSHGIESSCSMEMGRDCYRENKTPGAEEAFDSSHIWLQSSDGRTSSVGSHKHPQDRWCAVLMGARPPSAGRSCRCTGCGSLIFLNCPGQTVAIQMQRST